VISCLRGAGVEVVERHASVWEGRRDSWRAGAGTAARLAAAQARLARPLPPCDAVIVGYPGHADVPLARALARGRPVVFNPLVSLSDTLVEDRGRFRRGSSAARALAGADRVALRAADLVVADTEAQAGFLAELADIPRSEIEVCFVGAEERLFRPAWSTPERFTCLFVGKLIPLQGIETILAAARLAPDVDFRLVGSGQLEPLLRNPPANVDRVPWVEYERLPAELARCGCALGIFGTSAKARRVIPNKVFQALAVGAPVVTADTPAARELLVDGESAVLVQPGDAEALAATVRGLRDTPELAQRLAAAGAEAYRAQASEDVLGRRWRRLLEALL
jgi:glycosyltransferase involved in cell wall biosynthesis